MPKVMPPAVPTRIRKVPLRIDPDANDPMQVRFTLAESKALGGALKKSVHRNLSPFVRDLCEDAARATLDASRYPTTIELVKAAALECGLQTGEWVRLVVLAAIGATPIVDHFVAAKRFYVYASTKQ